MQQNRKGKVFDSSEVEFQKPSWLVPGNRITGMRALRYPRVVSLIVAVLAVGCGREAYERRLQETSHYFAYLDKLNQNLSAPWAGKGVQLRVPKSFIVIPPPQQKKKGAPADQRDPRQPTFADITFPGLQGAFTTDLVVSGKKTPEKGYLYVLTNGELLGRKGSDEKAAAFNNAVLHTIAEAVGQPDPPPEKLVNNSVPKGEAWVPKRTFKVVRPGFPASISGKDYRIEVYNTKQEKSQISLVYVLPENASPKLANNIDLSLETLQVTQPSGGGAGPQPTSTKGGI